MSRRPVIPVNIPTTIEGWRRHSLRLSIVNQELESQLRSLIEENERKTELIRKAKSALVVALHYTEADYTADGEQELMGCRIVLVELRQALSPIDPPLGQEEDN